MCKREAILNAVAHGNSHKPSSYFEVNLNFRKTELRINIADEGTGFDLKEKVREPEDLTLEQIGKRGLSFMASVAHKIIVRERGITLIFKENKI